MRLRLAVSVLVLLPASILAQERPYLGVTLDAEHPLLAGRGLLVLRVCAGTSADRAGLLAGDVIVRAGDRTIRSTADLVVALQRAGRGRLAFEVLRGGEVLPLAVELTARPSGQLAGAIAQVPDEVSLASIEASFERVVAAYAAGDADALAERGATARAMTSVLLASGVEAEVAGRLRATRLEVDEVLLLAAAGIAPPVNPLGQPADQAARIDRLIAELGSDSFETREDAAEALRELGPLARVQLQAALTAADQEVAWRARKMLDDLAGEGEKGAERLRPCRIEVAGVESDRIRFVVSRGEIPAGAGPVAAVVVRGGRQVGAIRLGDLGPDSARVVEGDPPAAGDRILWFFYEREKAR
mgnify:CR=1 FL=1